MVPLASTIPASGTHSRALWLRGRGLRFPGRRSKAASTQSATASAAGSMAGEGAGCAARGRPWWWWTSTSVQREQTRCPAASTSLRCGAETRERVGVFVLAQPRPGSSQAKQSSPLPQYRKPAACHTQHYLPHDLIARDAPRVPRSSTMQAFGEECLFGAPSHSRHTRSPSQCPRTAA